MVCGSKHDIETHHIISNMFGGNNDDNNLITLCKCCHNAVHIIRRKQDIQITEEGWAIFKNLVEKCKSRSVLVKDIDNLYRYLPKISDEEMKRAVMGKPTGT